MGIGSSRGHNRSGIASGRRHRSPPLHVLMARPEIQSGKDLKDKTIGVDSFAGTMECLSRVAAKHYGLDPNRDIKVLVTGPSPNRVAALKGKLIGAIPIDIAFAHLRSRQKKKD